MHLDRKIKIVNYSADSEITFYIKLSNKNLCLVVKCLFKIKTVALKLLKWIDEYINKVTKTDFFVFHYV